MNDSCIFLGGVILLFIRFIMNLFNFSEEDEAKKFYRTVMEKVRSKTERDETKLYNKPKTDIYIPGKKNHACFHAS